MLPRPSNATRHVTTVCSALLIHVGMGSPHAMSWGLDLLDNEAAGHGLHCSLQLTWLVSQTWHTDFLHSSWACKAGLEVMSAELHMQHTAVTSRAALLIAGSMQLCLMQHQESFGVS